MSDDMRPERVRFQSWADELVALQGRLVSDPYSIPLRLGIAKVYQDLGYPDLAAGDAYKALLLTDELSQEGEYHEEVLEAAKDEVESSILQKTAVGDDETNAIQEEDAIMQANTTWSSTAYKILVSCLIDCGSLRSAFDFTNRALRAHPDQDIFIELQSLVKGRLQSHFEVLGENLDDADVSDYPDKGLVRREKYFWNSFEPDRFSPKSIEYLNAEITAVAPKLEVKVSSLPVLTEIAKSSDLLPLSDRPTQYVNQLGVFARAHVGPGEEILKEKSLLTAVARLHDTYCDACSILLPTSDSNNAENRGAIACEDCTEVFFCSAECHDLAQEMYHPILCGIDMEQKVSNRDAADSLYFLLLVRAIALSHVQELHPLELKEVRYIWGDYYDVDSAQVHDSPESIVRTLPFSFDVNILKPLHMLEKMDVNIFEQSYRYDTWVFNTLYAKFRGTASARQGLDGRPEIGAVHPLWCLANHSCDPNVSWEWNGSIKFWARENLVDWKGRSPEKRPGIAQGEEIFSHYCDIRLPVKERREWAMGALGGECVCSRCQWEENEEIV